MGSLLHAARHMRVRRRQLLGISVLLLFGVLHLRAPSTGPHEAVPALPETVSVVRQARAATNATRVVLLPETNDTLLLAAWYVSLSFWLSTLLA